MHVQIQVMAECNPEKLQIKFAISFEHRGRSNNVISDRSLDGDVDERRSTALTQLRLHLDCRSLFFGLDLDLRHREQVPVVCVYARSASWTPTTADVQRTGCYRETIKPAEEEV